MTKSNLHISESEVGKWIDMLVDNELSEFERSAVLAALDRYPHYWRQCAVAFIDDQFFKQNIKTDLDSSAHDRPMLSDGAKANTVPGNSKLTLTAKSNRFGSVSAFFSSTAAVILLGLCVGMILAWVGNSAGYSALANGQRDTRQNQADNSGFDKASENDELLIASVASLKSLADEAETIVAEFQPKARNRIGSPSNLSRLFEIQNDARTAIYYSPDPIPEFILQSIVLAGHDVKLSDERMRTPIGGNQFVNLPVFAMRIDKNSMLTNQP